MPISLVNAEAAMKALRACKAAELFDKIRANQHSMEKHFSKGTAQAAAALDGYPQGYFKRTKSVLVSSANLQTVSEKLKGKALAKVGAKKAAEFGRKSRGAEVSVEQKSAASKDDILDIVSRIVASDDYDLRENPRNPESRFMLVASIPAGFYGRAIDGGGTKSKNVNNAVVIIDAGASVNPQIVTVFPADVGYVQGRPLLV